jgi:hypothetical protein
MEFIPSMLRFRSDGQAGVRGGATSLPPDTISQRDGTPIYDILPQRVGDSVMPTGYIRPEQQQTIATGGDRSRVQELQKLIQLQQLQGQGGMSGMMSPRDQAMMSAAATGLQLSGYQDRPITLGQGLGAMAQAGMKAYTGAQQEQRKSRLEEAMLGLKMAEAMKPDLTSAQRNAVAAGLKVGTPEYNKFIIDAVTKADTVFMGGNKQQEMAFGSALKTREAFAKKVYQDQELGARLQTVIDLINSGVETGRIQSAMLPLKQIARSAGFLSDEQLKELSNQEIIDSAAAFLTPRMRVVGAGASSDRDMDFFERATVRMANTPQANLVIATMQKQVMDYNRRRLSLFDTYINEFGNDFGFADYADEKMGNVYQSPSTSEELTQMVESGQIKVGDVFFNSNPDVMEFDILTDEMAK